MRHFIHVQSLNATDKALMLRTNKYAIRNKYA